ncbi:MAG: response regulator [Candidatus Hydrogenedentes bacterium]|nr:response regulator [Candidatus Hydrogenedentota bacterium]
MIVVGTEDGRLADILAGEIEAEGFAVAWCTSGQDVLDTVLAHSVAAVFLDGPLAVFDGYTTSTLLRDDPDVAPDLPVILLCATEPDRRRVERAGFSHVLPHAHSRQDVRELLSGLGATGPEI